MAVNQQQRIPLGSFPTPFESAPDLGELLGVNELWVKRDDLSGYSWGGNKIRTIEFLLGDAIGRGSDTVVICGGPTSNFAALMSVACARHGLAALRIVYGSRPSRIPSALAISLRSGAIVEFTDSPNRTSVDAAADAAAHRLRLEGRCPYGLPRGGATAIGALGLANAALELNEQLEQNGIDDVTIVVPVGSGGTIAGLIAGWTYMLDGTSWARAVNIEILGVSVSRPPDELRDTIRSLASDCAVRAGYDILRPATERCRWSLVDGRGAGFGLAGEREVALVDEIANRTRFLFDTTYNGKSLAWLRETSSRPACPIVYWHTGGALGVIDRISNRNASRVHHLQTESKPWPLPTPASAEVTQPATLKIPDRTSRHRI